MWYEKLVNRAGVCGKVSISTMNGMVFLATDDAEAAQAIWLEWHKNFQAQTNLFVSLNGKMYLDAMQLTAKRQQGSVI